MSPTVSISICWFLAVFNGVLAYTLESSFSWVACGLCGGLGIAGIINIMVD